MANQVEPDWDTLRTEILETFTPGPAINEVAEFAGRQDTIRRLQDIAIERARHAIIFGERGVGKTSLANVFHKNLNSRTKTVREISVNADSEDSFDSLWRKVFRRIQFPGEPVTLDLEFTGQIEPDHVFLQLARFGQNEIPIVIIDEYDRIRDDVCRILMTDAIKSFSKLNNNTTLILVGVAGDIIDLVRDHASISRNLVQIPMHRMSNEEIRDIITSRVRRLQMKITDDAIWRIAHFATGLPFYAHSLGKYGALSAIAARKTLIDEETVVSSIDRCMADVDYTIAEAYTRATEAIYRKKNMFSAVLAACALAQTNDIGQFTSAAVEAPLSAILEADTKVTAFSFHLNEMSGPSRGSVLVKTGERRTFQYHFREAAMQPYVVMKSLKEEIISKDIFERFYVRRQLRLSV